MSEPEFAEHHPDAATAADQQALIQFSRALAASADLRQRLQACTTPEQILALAAAQGCPFSWQTLRVNSRDLVADGWPWALKGTPWRHQFFSRPASD